MLGARAMPGIELQNTWSEAVHVLAVLLRRNPRMTRKRKLILATLMGLVTVLVGSFFFGGAAVADAFFAMIRAR